MNSFQLAMQAQAMQGPPCQHCDFWHQGYCPVKSGPPDNPTAVNVDADCELIALYSGPLVKASRSATDELLLQVADGPLYRFTACSLHGEWVCLKNPLMLNPGDPSNEDIPCGPEVWIRIAAISEVAYNVPASPFTTLCPGEDLRDGGPPNVVPVNTKDTLRNEIHGSLDSRGSSYHDYSCGCPACGPKPA